MKEQLTDIIKKLVSFPSVSDNLGARVEVLDWVDNWLEENGVTTKRYPSETAPSLIAEVDKGSDKTLLIMAHLDVVPASEELFEVKADGDILRGRGVIDNKGPAAVAMMLLKEAVNDGFQGVNIKAVFTTDEEVGGMEGAGRLISTGEFDNVSALFVPDGGDKNLIVCKEKGVYQIRIKGLGKSCHGSRPWLGENAIENGFRAYEKVKKMIEGEKTDDPNHWHPTVNIGRISAGKAINQVPDEAVLDIDIRFTEEYDFDKLEKQVKEAIAGKAEFAEVLNSGDILASEPSHPYIQKYKELAEEVTGESIETGVEHGASDARFFNRLGIPVWLQYPEGGDHHSESEWVSLSSLEKMVEVLKKYVVALGELK
ncbi:MAG: M20 family metallopeptidase [Patescibacteria group bacterium]